MADERATDAATATADVRFEDDGERFEASAERLHGQAELEQRRRDGPVQFRPVAVDVVRRLRDNCAPRVRSVRGRADGRQHRRPVRAVLDRPVVGHRGHAEPPGRLSEDGRAVRAARVPRGGRLPVRADLRAGRSARMAAVRFYSEHAAARQQLFLLTAQS